MPEFFNNIDLRNTLCAPPRAQRGRRKAERVAGNSRRPGVFSTDLVTTLLFSDETHLTKSNVCSVIFRSKKIYTSFPCFAIPLLQYCTISIMYAGHRLNLQILDTASLSTSFLAYRRALLAHPCCMVIQNEV